MGRFNRSLWFVAYYRQFGRISQLTHKLAQILTVNKKKKMKREVCTHMDLGRDFALDSLVFPVFFAFSFSSFIVVFPGYNPVTLHTLLIYFA